MDGNTLLQVAGPIVEFDWKEALAPPEQAQEHPVLLSPAERELVEAFVDFLRFRRNTAGVYPRFR